MSWQSEYCSVFNKTRTVLKKKEAFMYQKSISFVRYKKHFQRYSVTPRTYLLSLNPFPTDTQRCLNVHLTLYGR